MRGYRGAVPSLHLHIHTQDDLTGFLTGDVRADAPQPEYYSRVVGVQNSSELDNTAEVIAQRVQADRAKYVRVFRTTGKVEWQGSNGLVTLNLYHGRKRDVTTEDVDYICTRLRGLGVDTRIVARQK
jgi:hypothetical protein